MIPVPFVEFRKAFNEIRKWAGDITSSNRCALVMGIALKLKPGAGDLKFRGQAAANEIFRNQPMLDRMFVKAEELAANITGKFGPPDVVSEGKEALDKIKGKRGVLYMRNCWKTPTEKLTFWSPKMTGDHIDLWDGSTIEIYRHNENANSLVTRAEKVLLWELN